MGHPRRHLVVLVAAVAVMATFAPAGGTPPRDAGATQPAAGCGRAAEAGRQTLTVTSNGLTYAVPVHVPASYRSDRATPLLVALHGATQSGTAMMTETALDEAAERHGFLLAVPDGGIPHAPLPVNLFLGYFWHVPGSPMVGGGPVPPGSRDDEAFVLDVATAMAEAFCVDTRRRYLTGASNGAFLTSYLACHHADVFAAFAPVMGVQAGRPDDSEPTRPDPRTVDRHNRCHCWRCTVARTRSCLTTAMPIPLVSRLRCGAGRSSTTAAAPGRDR